MMPDTEVPAGPVRERQVFWEQFRAFPEQTGAIAPAGLPLARCLAEVIRPAAQPRRFLEVGPGTGPVTEAILPCLGEDDHLDIVEVNPRFCEFLESKVSTDPKLRRWASHVTIYQRKVQEHPASAGYAGIVSSLPLNNFDSDEVARILSHFERLAIPGGQLAFYEYLGARYLRLATLAREDRKRAAGVSREVQAFLARHATERRTVWWNLFPSRVYHVTLANVSLPSGHTSEPGS
jgi:phospholipid N-methyltransferase